MEPDLSHAYVALSAPSGAGRRDAVAVVDIAPHSPTFGRQVGRAELPHAGNEIRSLGWSGTHLVAPGVASSRVHILDTEPSAVEPRLVKVIEGAEVNARTGYAAPHTVRCGSDGIYVTALGTSDGGGPGGIFTLDRKTFDIRGRWERERGPQRLASDFHWHPRHGALITSEWGTPAMVGEGVRSDVLRAGEYGRALHVWELESGVHRQVIDLGAEHQMVLPLCPANNPARAYGFVSAMLSRLDLSASVFVWYLGRPPEGGHDGWHARKVITIPARVADPARLPAIVRDQGVVPPLVSDMSLSADDRWLYVSCWGTGELRRYDVTDPFNPVLTGLVRLGGIVRRTAHPSTPPVPRNGGPQAIAVSRDGRHVYVTNGFHRSWDDQFYPDGIGGWLVKVDAHAAGGLSLDQRMLVEFEDGIRPNHVRLRETAR